MVIQAMSVIGEKENPHPLSPIALFFPEGFAYCVDDGVISRVVVCMVHYFLFFVLFFLSTALTAL